MTRKIETYETGKSYYVLQEKGDKRQKRRNSDAGNRTPSCCVRDSDVSHYTTSDVVEQEKYFALIIQIFGVSLSAD
jgi:hypothetical protein